MTAVILFSLEYNLPRPPENLNGPDHDIGNSAHFLADESSQNSSFLIQMFLSEMQENDTPALCPPTGPMTEGETTAFPLALKEGDNFFSGTESTFSQPVSCVKSCRDNSELVCSTNESMLNPLDDPFVSNFANISALETSLLHQTNIVPSMPVDCTLNSLSCPSTPKSADSSEVDVQTMLSSTTCEATTGMFDLSECVNFLSTPVSPNFPSTPTSPCPSPVSTSSAFEESSPVDSLQVSSLLKDLDFSSFTTQDFHNVISTITHLEEPLSESTSSESSTASSPISVGSPVFPSPTDVVKTSRKRKRSEADQEEASPVRSECLSSDFSSSTFCGSEDQPLSTEQKKVMRREKNNAASVVSRAKRRQRFKDIRAREKELEMANAELREKVEWLTAETKRFRDKLLHKLSQ